MSTYFKDKYCEQVFAHPRWKDDPDELGGMKKAIGDVLHKLEYELIENRSIDTEFSGSTYVFTALRGGTLLVANVGDSRVTLGIERDGLPGVPVSLFSGDDDDPESVPAQAR